MTQNFLPSFSIHSSSLNSFHNLKTLVNRTLEPNGLFVQQERTLLDGTTSLASLTQPLPLARVTSPNPKSACAFPSVRPLELELGQKPGWQPSIQCTKILRAFLCTGHHAFPNVLSLPAFPLALCLWFHLLCFAFLTPTHPPDCSPSKCPSSKSLP